MKNILAVVRATSTSLQPVKVRSHPDRKTGENFGWQLSQTTQLEYSNKSEVVLCELLSPPRTLDRANNAETYIFSARYRKSITHLRVYCKSGLTMVLCEKCLSLVYNFCLHNVWSLHPSYVCKVMTFLAHTLSINFCTLTHTHSHTPPLYVIML